MKKIFLPIFCLLLANLASAQVTDSTTTKTEIKKTITTTKITTTTTVVTEKTDTIRRKDKTAREKVRVDTKKKNIIKLGFVGISYERVLSNKVTAQLVTSYLFDASNAGNTSNAGNSPNYSQTPLTRFSGFGVGAELRYYPKSIMRGFFLALSPRYQYYDFTVNNGAKDNNGNVTDAKANWNACNVAVLLGNQWIFNDIISLDIFIGPAVVGGVLDITQGTRNAFTLAGTGAVTGVTLRAGLNVGFVF